MQQNISQKTALASLAPISGLPQGAMIEVRSGRTKAQFEEFDRVNHERNLPLLSLHLNESEIYSAVWISRDHFETAKAVLLARHCPGGRIEG